MNTAQVVETSVTVNIQDYVQPRQTHSAYLWNDSWVQIFHKIRAISRQYTYFTIWWPIKYVSFYRIIITISDLVNFFVQNTKQFLLSNEVRKPEFITPIKKIYINRAPLWKRYKAGPYMYTNQMCQMQRYKLHTRIFWTVVLSCMHCTYTCLGI